MIVAFCGPIGAGKTTAAAALAETHEPVNFADPLRWAMETINPIVHVFGDVGYLRYTDAVEQHGYREAKDRFPEIRRLMQVVGTDFGREVDPYIWVNLWQEHAAQHSMRVIADDLRFTNEYDRVRALGGKVIRILRPGCDNTPDPAEVHESERYWPTFDVDLELWNTGTIEQLQDAIRQTVWS